MISGERIAGSPSMAVLTTASMDGSLRELIASLPGALRPVARALPHRLGLTASPSGGFEDFVILHPNRELPLYAAEDPAAPGGMIVAPERALRFVRAHHFGGFCWLLRDRLADGQVQEDAALLELRDRMWERWIDALGAATEDVMLTREVVDDVTARWRRGVRHEREMLRGGTLRPAPYAGMVREKLRWISASSLALLIGAGQRERARLFQRGYDLFLLSLQCIDDVKDQREDRALHGRDVPAALGCSPSALLRAAPRLAARAGAIASEGRFARFAAWLSTFAAAIAGRAPTLDTVADEMEAIGLVAELEGEAA